MEFHLGVDKLTMVKQGEAVHGVYPYVIILRKSAGAFAVDSP